MWSIPREFRPFYLPRKKDDFFLTVCRLVSYKQVKLIVQAFNQLQLPLVVIGDGPDLPLLQELAQPNVQILEPQPNAVVEDYMARAKAFVYGACEDFGIALVEAQAVAPRLLPLAVGGIGNRS
ncbi:glycosyltransferase [Synechocystis sp. B12]|nr:glycosyltransferase [Synechocystis sp. B12]